MTTKRKRLIWILALTPVVILLLLGGGIFYMYRKGVAADKAVEPLGTVKISPDGKIKLGDTVTASVLLKCPWHRRPVAAKAVAGKGTRLVAKPDFARISRGLGADTWKVSVRLKPYRLGAIPDGKLDIQFNRYNDKTKMLDMKLLIPSFVVDPIKLGAADKLQLAGSVEEIAPPSYIKYYVAGGLIVLLIIGAIVYIAYNLGRRAELKAVSPWDLALMRLHGIRSLLGSGSADLETCFVSLTDVVRSYLEERFSLRAPTQTTDEFLHELRDSDVLPEEDHRRFLEDFMTSADLVKFAKMPPSESDLLHTVSKAETLINETRPVEKPEENEGGEK